MSSSWKTEMNCLAASLGVKNSSIYQKVGLIKGQNSSIIWPEEILIPNHQPKMDSSNSISPPLPVQTIELLKKSSQSSEPSALDWAIKTKTNKKGKSTKFIRIASWNVHSINPKIDFISQIFMNDEIDILAIQETWLNPKESNPKCNGASWIENPEHRVSCTTGSKGLGFFIKKPMNSLCEIISSSDRHIAIKFNTKKPCLILNVYAPSDNEKFNWIKDKLNPLIDDLSLHSLPLIVLGDMNTDLSKSNNCSKKLTEIITDYNLFSSIKKSTKTWFRGNLSSRIDYIFLSNSIFHSLVDSGSTHTGYSDHSIIHVKLKNNYFSFPSKSLSLFQHSLKYICSDEKEKAAVYNSIFKNYFDSSSKSFCSLKTAFSKSQRALNPFTKN